MTTAAAADADTLVTHPCACASLRRAARAVTRSYENYLKYTGVTLPQFTLLQALDLAGPTRQGRLSDMLGLDTTTLSRTLTPLAQSGWIEQAPGKDRRQQVWVLTTSGRRKLTAALPAWNRAQSRWRGRLGKSRWERLLSELAAIAATERPQ